MIIDSGVVTGSLVSIGPLTVTGSVISTIGFTGSLSGSVTAAISSSYALTASYAVNSTTASYAVNSTTAQTASSADNFTVRGTLTAQNIVVQTITSSIEFNTGSTRNGSSSSNTHEFTGSVSITGSLQVNGSNIILSNQTSSMSVATASFIQNSQTASYVLNAVSSSYASSALTASNALTAPYSGLQGTTPIWNQNTTGVASTASYVITAQTASYVLQAVSSSFAINALTASYAANVPLTSSYALFANTSSFALTASYISGSGAGVGFPFSGSAVITGSLFVSSSFISGSFTGSLQGTSSYASFSNTASYAASSSYTTFAVSASSAPGFTTTKYQATPAVTWSFVHNLNTRNPLLQIYDLSYNQVIPNAIIGLDAITAEIRFDYSASGYAVASNGGGLLVTGSTSLLDQVVPSATWSFAHNLNTKYPAFEVYDSNDLVIIPSGIRAINNNSAELYFAFNATGKAIAQFSGINGAPNATTASFAATASSLNPITNSFIILSNVSSSLNFVDDTAASAGGVPLGGLYRNGNFILIRLS